MGRAFQGGATFVRIVVAVAAVAAASSALAWQLRLDEWGEEALLDLLLQSEEEVGDVEHKEVAHCCYGRRCRQ